MGHSSHKVLYIEDQPEMIDLVRLTLRRLGCEVLGATDGAQGLRMMRDIRPDLVLLDLMLPGWDGWQVRRAMDDDVKLKDLPVVLVTARVPTGNGNQHPLPRADAYITKPFSIAQIRSTVESLLQERVAAV